MKWTLSLGAAAVAQLAIVFFLFSNTWGQASPDKGGEKGAPAPAPKAPQALPAVKAQSEPPAGPPATSDDPRIKTAQAQKEAISLREKELKRAMGDGLATSLGELQGSIDAMKPGKLSDERAALDSLRKVVVELRSFAKELLGRQADYKKQISLYQAELQRAPVAFRPAADVFEQMSREEPIKEFKDRYAKLAASLRELAKVMEKRAAELPAEEKEIGEAYRYVAAAEKYLGSLQEWLGTYPEFSSGLEREKHIEELRRFIQHFRQLDSAFDRFNKKVINGPGESK